MAQAQDSPLTFTAGEAIEQHKLVYLSGTRTVSKCVAGTVPVGVALAYTASGDPCAVAMLTKDGTLKMFAGASITANDTVYTAADGKVSGTVVGDPVGKALATVVSGDYVEVLPIITNRGVGVTDTFTYFNDFTHYTTATDGVSSVITDSGAIAVSDAANGVVSLSCSQDSSVADNDETYLITTKEVFTIEAGKNLVLKARVKLTEANTDDANIIFGLTDSGAANMLLDNGGGPAASYDGAVFFKVDGGTVWQAETSNAGTQSTDTSAGAFTSAAWTDLLITITSLSSDTVAVCKFYVNGTLGATLNITISGLEEMEMIVGVKNGGANEETLLVDYIYGSKDR